MPLPIDQLVAMGLSRRAVEAWRSRGIRFLLPVQEQALAEHGFLHGKNLLVFAPTSSGKTLIAEMAALRRLEQNRRAIYLTPTKALAEEKYRAFLSLYGAMGYRIAVATRERPATDGVVLGGRYDLLVAVYEKMKAYLVARPEMLGGVALVIADEIQTLGEPRRGAMIDLLLTKIGRSPYPTQLIGLSAVLGEDAARLASWLGCDLMISRERPLELREGVFDLSRNTFFYKCFNTGQEGQERLGEDALQIPALSDEENEPADFRREAILSLARRLAVDYGEQVLVFVPTRYDSRNWAHHLASRLSLPPSEALLEELSLYEDTHARELLREVAARGVAFHNADLSWDLRALIERHFNAGSLRVLISTSTLGQGVNLTGRNVLHVHAMVTTDPWTGRQTRAALSRSRFHNQGGRGARFSREVDFGRSMLVARNEAECERMMRDYVEGEIEPLTPQIDPGSLDLYTLDLVASRVACTKEALTTFFHNTFSGRVLWQAEAAPVARRIDETVEALAHRDLLRVGEDGRLETTGLGEVAASTGLQSATVERIAAWLREGPRVLPDDPIEALVVLAATGDAREFPLSAPTGSSVAEAFVEPLRERLLRRAEGAAPSVEKILSPAGGFTREALADFKKALALDAWIGPEDTREIEERFQVFSGTLANLASHFAWLAQGAAALARSLALPSGQRRALECLAERLVLGCGVAGMDFRNLRVQGLSRAYLRTLVREGYCSVASLAAADLTNLSRLLPPRIAEEAQAEARRLVGCPEGPDGETADDSAAPRREESAVARDEESGPKPHERERAERQEEKREGPVRSRAEIASEARQADLEPGGKTHAPDKSDVLLEVDLRGAGRVLFHGKELRLPNLAFRLLTVLAHSPQIGVSYEEILRSVWPDAHVEPQQIFAHRRRLLESLAEVVPLERAGALIQVEKSRGLRLTLPAEQVRVIER